MPDRNWKAFESPNKEFDEFGDDDSDDLDKNFKPADPKPESKAKDESDFESYKQDEIVDKNPMYSYDGKKREGVYDANKDRKGSNETVYRSQSGLINGTETYETVDVDFSESDSAVEFTCNCGAHVTEESLPKHMEEAHGSKLTEARYKTYKTKDNYGITESDANVNDIHLGKKTRAGESLAREVGTEMCTCGHFGGSTSKRKNQHRSTFDFFKDAFQIGHGSCKECSGEVNGCQQFTWTSYDGESKSNESIDEWWNNLSDVGQEQVLIGSGLDARLKGLSWNNLGHKNMLSIIQEYGSNPSQWNESKAGEDKLDKAELDIDDEEEYMDQVEIGKNNPPFDAEAKSKEDFGFGLHPNTDGQDNFDSAFGVSTPEEEKQIEDSIDDKMDPVESEYFDIKSEYWEDFVNDPAKLDQFLERVQSLRSEAEQAVATIPRRRTGMYTRRNFDEVEWLNNVINDMNGIIRQAEPMKNQSLFESFPRGNVGESLAREDQMHTQDGWWRNMQDVDFNFESLQKAIADIEVSMNGASTSEMIQLQQEYDYYNELLRKFTEDKSNLDQYGIVNQGTPEYSTAPWGTYESANAEAVWKSYEMEDEYEIQNHGQGWNTETDEEDDDQSKVSLNINSGTLTDKQIETEEHHTKSDKDSTSPDDEGFSTADISAGNYEKIHGYNPEPNHELGSHHLKSKKGERHSKDTPASETETFYSNIIGKLSGLESDE